MDYYIENGVRRSVAAREAGLTTIMATLHEPGKPPTVVQVALDELHSPKKSISQSDPRFVRALQGMASPVGRMKMPSIDVQRLGEKGQAATVPLTQVVLDP